MYRVVTKNRNRNGGVTTERGPWHARKADADYWADTLRALGYLVEIESMDSDFGKAGNDDLANALSSMA